ncbi:MAG: hypothetical protein H8E26_11955 [FCB group bacterium]|nr:hypothetical protein [FCB group bacterium]MBL7027030.1 hypothetical protein [Candidatus Neomarinimicrobiota bacterium]MBL7122210.1 hypothetical protein [Candidatus Neomarinimicrobiota bacterium]
MLRDDQNFDQYPWMVNFKKNPIPVLLKAAPLPVRYQLVTDILEDSSSEEFLALQKNLRKHQPRRKLLADQNGDGLWPIDGKTSGLSEAQIQTLQLLKQQEVLHELLDFSVTYKQEKVMLGMREVLRSLAEQELQLRLHHQSQAVFLAVTYQLEGNPIIKQLIRDIIARQNSDGGWSSLPDETSSCYWSSLFFMWTLGQSEKFRENRALKKGLKYLESKILQEGESNLLPGMQVWDTLISGTSGLSILSGGTLRYLETIKLIDGKNKDRKTYKMLDWLVDAQLKTGLWPSIVSRDRQGDFGVTLRVLKVLKHFQSQRVQETRKYDSDF